MDTTPVNSSTIGSKAVRFLLRRGKLFPRAALRILPFLFCFFAAAVTLFLLNKLFIPKYMSGIYEGALIAEYYDSEKNHELIIIGDCEAYENISPITLWEDYGITSFIRGSPQQLMWQSYYLLQDTLRYEKPRAVIFSVFAMQYGSPRSEAYNRLTLDGMKFSAAKIAAVNASMTEGESFISYIFPLFRYHERFKKLSYDDVRYIFKKRGVSFNGFMMRCDVKPLGTLPTPQKLGDYAFSESCWEYLNKMTELCKQNKVDLMLLKAPAPYPHWYPEWDAQIAEYADTHGLLYINALNELDAIGIDFSADTYDGGLHLNLWGAQKLARYLGNILRERGLSDLRSNAEINRVWTQKARAYEALKNIQLEEIATAGKVITLTKE